MTCKTCGAAVTTVESTSDGEIFMEKHECSEGHVGYVEGREGESPANYDRHGEVFRE